MASGAMSETPAPSEIAYPDRSGGLAFFGVFFVAVGLLLGVTGWLNMETAAPDSGGQLLSRVAVGRAGISFVYAAAIATLGVGSLLARRWARALLLCAGGLACFGGALAFAEVCGSALTGSLPHPIASLNPAVQSGIFVIEAASICLGTPLATVAFYWREDVWRTCLARDPRERWTDRCPLPILACCIAQALTSLAYLFGAIEGRPFPFFGRYHGGAAATVAQLLVFVFAACAARAFYLRKLGAWRAYIALFLVLSVSSLLTRLRLHAEPHGLIFADSVDLTTPGRSHLFFGAAAAAVFDAVQLAYFLYSRRFFQESP
jgi:hypothetical protein